MVGNRKRSHTRMELPEKQYIRAGLEEEEDLKETGTGSPRDEGHVGEYKIMKAKERDDFKKEQATWSVKCWREFL